MKKILFCVGVAAVLTASSFGQTSESVGLLRLGMTQREANAALGPAFVEYIKRMEPKYPGEAYASAMMRNPRGESDPNANQEAYTLEYVQDRLVYIYHHNTWQHDQPNFEETRQAISKKYGPSTVPWATVGTPQTNWEWAWDDRGQPVADPFRCRVETSSIQKSFSVPILATPRAARHGCGLSIHAFISGSNGLLNDMKVQMTDNKTLYEAIQQQQRRLSGKQQQIIEDSHRVKAPL